MKIKKLFGGLFLSFALVAGVGAGLAIKEHKVEGTAAATNTVTLAGSFNGWSTTATPLTLNGDYWTIERQFDANVTFKIVVNGSDWVGDGDGVHWCSGMGSEGKGQNFKVLTAGKYVIKASKTIGDYGDKSYGVYFELGTCIVTKYAVVNGTKESTAMGTDNVTTGNTYSVPGKVYRANYECAGWYTNVACTTAYSATAIRSDTTIYAKYTSHAAWTGTIYVDLLHSGWADAAAKYAICFMNKTTYTTEVSGWSNFVTGINSGVKLITFSYSLPFNPLTMTIVRFNTTATEPDWSKKWNQTPDISVATMVRIGDSKDGEGKNYTYDGFPRVMGGDPWAQKGTFTNVKLNDSNHAEYYGDVTLAQWEKFNILKAPYADGDYAASYSTHSSLTSSFQDGGSGSIQAKVAGTYSVYFDSTNNSVYITTVAISEADEWAHYFMDHVGCDATGVNVPTGWTACANEYADLVPGAKNIIYSASPNPSTSAPIVNQAIARYEAALRSHPSLTHFIVNSSGVAKVVAISIQFPVAILAKENEGMIIAVIVGVISAVTISGYFFLRKRRNEK